jgi:hypothetical protein
MSGWLHDTLNSGKGTLAPITHKVGWDPELVRLWRREIFAPGGNQTLISPSCSLHPSHYTDCTISLPKLPHILWNFHYHVHNSWLLKSILARWIQYTPSHLSLCELHFNIILQPVPKSSMWSLSSGFSTKMLYVNISLLLHMCYMLHQYCT